MSGAGAPGRGHRGVYPPPATPEPTGHPPRDFRARLKYMKRLKRYESWDNQLAITWEHIARSSLINFADQGQAFRNLGQAYSGVPVEELRSEQMEKDIEEAKREQ